MNLPDVPGAPVEVVLFALFSILAIAGAIRVVTARDPFASALSLLFNFVALGCLYLMLDQVFVAIAQIMVYAGAVVVLFLFVIAYLGDRRELVHTHNRLPILKPLAFALMAVGGGLFVWMLNAAQFPDTIASPTKTAAGFNFGSVQAVGEAFLGEYLIAFEMTSLVLLVAAVGGITLGLTGRARHQRLRKVQGSRSSDQQRKWYRKHEQELIANRLAKRKADAAARAASKENPS